MNLQELLKHTLDHKASDLHLVVGAMPKIRLEGQLVNVPGEVVLERKNAEEMIFALLNPEQKQLLLENKELDFSFSLGDQARFRVNVYYQKGNLSASLRFIPSRLPTIDELGLPRVCYQFVNLRQGLILVTGPTGHGKSTSIAAILQEINKTRTVHIVTIEDPIEYVYQGEKALISQRELHNDTLSWNAALGAVVREDPDVVLIGEMRDYETMAAALTIAETGHLVFATLHTNSAAQTIDRIVDVFPENQQAQVRLQLSGNLEAVISQRLIPKTDGGRVVACEVMMGTPAVKSAIRDGKTHLLDNIIQTSGEVGMGLLEMALARMVKNGVVTREVATAYAIRPNEMFRQLRGNI